MYAVMHKDELYHHGILGQKWGVRRFQNYDGTLKAKGKEHKKETKEKAEETKERKGLSDGQKKAIKIGLAVAATALVAYGGYKLYDSGALDNLKGIGKTKYEQIIDDEGPDLSKYSETVQEAYHKSKEIVSQMNPTGSTDNCGPASILTYCSKRLGKEFQASAEPMDSWRRFGEFFDGFDIKNSIERVNPNGMFGNDPKATFDDMLGMMKDFGNGAGGVLSYKYANGDGSGHFLEWKVIEDVVMISDGQNNIVSLNDDAFNNPVMGIYDMLPASCFFARLDDYPIKEDTLAKLTA